MKTILQYIRARRKRKIEERIAKLQAEADYWRSLKNGNGMTYVAICELVADRLGEIAALQVRLRNLNR